MSLVGSLEDLSLGDILQIISLSQKSGVLELQTTGCDGRIVFVSGLVRGAAIKNGPQDLRGVLVAGGFVSEEDFEVAAAYARDEGCPVRDAIASLSPLSQERIDSLCREAIESAVVTMFGWTTGDFSFDVRSDAEPGDPELLLQTGINAQYLAMEGARQSDETDNEPASRRAGEEPAKACEDTEVQPGFDEMSAHELFGVMPESEQAAPVGSADGPGREGAVQSLAMAALDRVDSHSADGPDAEPIAHAEPEPDEAEPDEPVLEPELISEADIERPRLAEVEPLDLDRRLEEPVEAAPELGPEPAVEATAGPSEAEPLAGEAGPPPGTMPCAERAVVVVDDDLVALEWVKTSLKDRFSPVHIFQNTDQALGRIRQYLVRGEPPVVLLSPTVPVDSLAGIRDSADFVARLKSQSARVVAFWLLEDGVESRRRMGRADGVLTRPDRSRLRLTGAAEQLAELAGDFALQLQQEVLRADSSEPSQAAVREAPRISPDALRKLRDATRALTKASSRGEVLPLVIRFAADIFSRVAMFMVREGVAVGMAQHGLDRCGGPDDLGLRELRMETATSNWMSAVLEQGKPVHTGPSNGGDRNFALQLGERIPGRAYMAPIESTGQVIALLYADNLPEDGPIGDTSALEVVLHHAGLALDRAALERALSENEGERAGS